MKKIVILVVILFVIGCSYNRQEAERSNLNKARTLQAIKLLESEGFLGFRCKMLDSKFVTEGSINDNPVKFLIDTGASFSFVNNSFAAKNNLLLNSKNSNLGEVKSAFGSIEADENIYIPKLEVSGLIYSNWPMHVLNVNRQILTLGSDFLFFNQAVLFCRYGIVMNSSEKSSQLASFLEASDYDSSPILLGNGEPLEENIPDFQGITPYVTVNVNGEDKLMLIDTGATFSTVFKNHNIFHTQGVKTTNWRLSGASGKSKQLNVTNLDSLKINDTFILKNERIAIVDQQMDKLNKKVYGTIGMDLLAKKNMILDYGNNKIYWSKD
ncbi:MAG: retroviral-like aspartic protease family protein [Candidatus Cloacimonadales bacterium]